MEEQLWSDTLPVTKSFPISIPPPFLIHPSKSNPHPSSPTFTTITASNLYLFLSPIIHFFPRTTLSSSNITEESNNDNNANNDNDSINHLTRLRSRDRSAMYPVSTPSTMSVRDCRR
ncbi:hypothetical protein KC359_g216 [Hortaea werneckii]|nr:hypothetical protein KC359_g216 [Hortaea werneckii]